MNAPTDHDTTHEHAPGDYTEPHEPLAVIGALLTIVLAVWAGSLLASVAMSQSAPPLPESTVYTEPLSPTRRN